jgi:MFS family permease
LFIFRSGIGIFQAFCGPCAYSLIADYFPADQRTTSNSIYSLGIFLGSASSSLTLDIIGMFGWRQSLIYIGVLGCFMGIAGLLFIQEPDRGRFEIQVNEEKMEEDEQEMYGCDDNCLELALDITAREEEKSRRKLLEEQVKIKKQAS